MNPLRALRLLRAGIGDLLENFAEWCQRVDADFADAVNGPEDEL